MVSLKLIPSNYEDIASALCVVCSAPTIKYFTVKYFNGDKVVRYSFGVSLIYIYIYISTPKKSHNNFFFFKNFYNDNSRNVLILFLLTHFLFFFSLFKN